MSYNHKVIGYESSDCSSKILNIDEIKNWLHVVGLVESEEYNFCLNTSSTHFAENSLGYLFFVKKFYCDVKACESLSHGGRVLVGDRSKRLMSEMLVYRAH